MSIELNQVSYTYAQGTAQAVTALEHIDLSVGDGEFIGIMGHTGCGKSTLLHLIAGLLTPSSGQIFLDGKDIHAKKYDRSILRRNVGVIFQYPEYQLFETTVEKDVAFGLRHSGLSKAEIRLRVKYALEQTGFSYENIRKESPLSLSGGEKRRVAIAGVLAIKPRVLLLDEPIASLDPGSRADFLNMIMELNREGVTVFMISHHTDSLCEYASRLLVLSHGKLIMDGTPKDIFADTRLAEVSGIRTGQIQQIACMLNDKGFPISGNIIKYGELLDELKCLMKGGGTSCMKD